jgi:signal transduction histidine kinase
VLYLLFSAPASRRSHGGLELGLAIVRQLVELHGGTVSAESPGEGEGATFKVIFPLWSVDQVLRDQTDLKKAISPLNWASAVARPKRG